MRLCAACGKPAATAIMVGVTVVCPDCEPDLSEEIEIRRGARRPVNATHLARRIFNRKYSGGNYLLRAVPAELWARIGHRVVDEKCSIRELILLALYEYLEKEMEVSDE